jgi:3-oxoacyl-[acyl-carrier protein] reductase
VLAQMDRETPEAVVRRQLAVTRELMLPAAGAAFGEIDVDAWKQTAAIMADQQLIPAGLPVDAILMTGLGPTPVRSSEMDALTAVVTGGTRGIGLGLAECLARRGASVAITYHRDDNAAENARRVITPQLARGPPAAGAAGRCGRRASVGGAAPRDSGNPGAGPCPGQQRRHHAPGLLRNADRPDWDETLRINLSSAFYWCREVIPGMKALGFGRIVNIASIAARGGGVIGPHYAASKAGMLGLTRYGASELGPFGITA